MAYTPDQLILIGDQLGRVYQRAQVEILEQIISAQTSDWKRSFLEQRLTQIEQILNGLGQADADWQTRHLRELYTNGIKSADAGLRGVRGVAPPPRVLASIHQSSINVLSEQMALSLGEARAMVGRQVEDLFRRAALESIRTETAIGGTARDAAKRMVQTWEQKGITAFQDVRGNQWGLDTYANMVARTTTREATNQGLKNRLSERGRDLVEITRHGGECEKCQEALDSLGEIYSLSGNSERYPALDEAEALGLFHPNCVHVPVPYIETEAA